MAKNFSKRRLILFNRSPYCFWCSMKLVWVSQDGGQLPNNAVTLDHLRSRLHPNRQEPEFKSTERTVLACPGCNQARASIEVAQLPIEEKWKRSGRYPRKEHNV